MPATNFSITNQHDLLLASAAILAAPAGGSYTLTLANSVALAGDIALAAPGRASIVTLAGNGFSLLGTFTLDVSGHGTVVLNAANTSTAGVIFTGDGTLELGRADAAGLGIVTLSNGNAFSTLPLAILKLDPGAILGNPVSLAGAGANQGLPNLNYAIDLAGVVAAAPFVTVDAGLGLVIPVSGGGTVLIETELVKGTTFLLTPDGSGGTMVQETTLAVATGVTVGAGQLGNIVIPFDTVTDAPKAQVAVAPLNAAVIGGIALPVLITQGSTPPAAAAGQTVELIAHAAGAYTLPNAAGAALISDATAPITVTGGDANGQLILAGTGGLTFVAGKGSGTVIAGGGANAITVNVGLANQTIQTGGGNDTIIAFGGNDIIAPGGGANLVKLGVLSDTLTSVGTDTIIGGTGAATLSVNPSVGGSLVFLGTGGSNYSGGGASTIVGNGASNVIQTNGNSRSLLFLGTSSGNVTLGGADTVLAGSGGSYLQGSGQSLVFGGAGPLSFTAGSSGIDTVVGNPAGVVTIHGAGGFPPSGLLAFAYGAMDYEGAFTNSVPTIIGTTAALTVHAGYYGGIFVGGSGGHNFMTGYPFFNIGATPVVELIGGGDADTLSAGGAFAALQPAAGASTLIGGSSINLFTFVHGVVSNDLVQGFDLHLHYISLANFPQGEVAAALAGATTANGSEQLSLSDGTHITFQGVTGLTAANFL